MSFELTEKQIEAFKLLNSDALHVLLAGGARSGKTFVILFFILMRAIKYPGCRQLICRFYLADLKGSIINDSLFPLLKILNADFYKIVKKLINKQDWYIELPNGSQIWFSGLGNEEQVDKALGREYSLIFINEATQIEFNTCEKIKTRLSQNIVGLKLKLILDCNPTTISSWIYKLFIEHIDPIDSEKKTKDQYASMRLNPVDNSYLRSEYVENILMQLSFRQRQRFLDGIWVEEVQGALWKLAMINQHRATFPEEVEKVVIGVDPGGFADQGDETGIVVVASNNGHGYIKADLSGKYTPADWAKCVVDAYYKFNASAVVVEVNQGGRLVEDNLRNQSRHISIVPVRAASGKIARAEPIAALYEEGLVHHCGHFRELEAEMMSWCGDKKKSPNRIDALVWACYHLFIKKLGIYIISTGKGFSV